MWEHMPPSVFIEGLNMSADQRFPLYRFCGTFCRSEWKLARLIIAAMGVPKARCDKFQWDDAGFYFTLHLTDYNPTWSCSTKQRDGFIDVGDPS